MKNPFNSPIARYWGSGIAATLLSLVTTGVAQAQAATSMDTVYEVRSGNDRVYVANPDHDSVTVVNAFTGRRQAIIGVGDEPRSLALDGNGNLWVVNKTGASISIINTTSLRVTNTFPGPYGSRPHGIVMDTNGNRAYVVLEASGSVLQLNTLNGAILNTLSVGANPRTVSINADGSRIYLPRFVTRPISGESGRSPAHGNGEIVVVSTAGLTRSGTIQLPFNTASGGDTNRNARGVPNYVRGMAISPDGNRAYVPAKIDNIYRGSFRDGRNRQHNMLTRGILSQINLNNNRERLGSRIEFANNSAPTAAAYNPAGNHLYAIHRGSRAFEIINPNNGSILYQTTLGFAPTGLAVAANGRRVYVHNWLGRSLSILNISGNSATVGSTVNLINRETLSPQVLLGKRLFHDSADPRLSAQRYISCAACHDEGGQDGRVYDFSDAGEGLRNTTEMRGRGDMEDGLVHWTANFDEIQDFEHALRELFGGTGLMSDAAFNATNVAIDASRMKTGRSAPLDALVAFIDTMDNFGASPHRQQNGSLTSRGQAGRQVFEAASCATCHSGDHFSDSPLGGSHNIGTVDGDTGGRFGRPLVNGGLDTPPLKGSFQSAPYLHDGSAPTIRAAINAHTQNMPVSLSSFSSREIDDLALYVQQIDDREPAPQPPDVPPSNPDTFSTFANISIDGNWRDWRAAAIIANDARDTTGGANILDYDRIWMANNANNLFIRYRNHRPNNTRLTWGYGQAFDVNGPARGYRATANRVPIGVDFLMEEETIYRYTGSGANWSWAPVATVPVEFRGRNAEFSIPRSILGNPDSVDMFMYADNNAVGGSSVDFIPDAAPNTGAPLHERFFTYEFAGRSTRSRARTLTSNDVPAYSNPVESLTLDGNQSDWATLDLFPMDPDDVDGEQNVIDFRQAGMAHDDENFYFGWSNDGSTHVTWGNAIFADTDLNPATGFGGFEEDSPIGIDYLIEGSSIYRYTGNGTSWSWQEESSAFPVTSGENIEIRVPIESLGGAMSIDVLFYGDSQAIGGTGTDFYPDAATDTSAANSSRHFRYTRDAALASDSSELISREALMGDKKHQVIQGGAAGTGWLSLLVIFMTILKKYSRPVTPLRKLSLVLALPVVISACDGGTSGTKLAPLDTNSNQPATSVSFSPPNDQSETPSQPTGGVMKTTLTKAADTKLTFEELQTIVFGPMCAGCHFGGGLTQPSVFDFTNADATYQSLVNQAGTRHPNETLVIPGDAFNSYLIRSLEGTQDGGSRMPMRAAPLTEHQLNAVRNWINDGASR